MGHKYLEDIGVTANRELWWLDNASYPNDKRIDQWKKEREVYGFDDRETWELQFAFYFWLYERLMMYVEHAGTIVNLEYHTFEYEGKEYNQKQLIDLILERLRFCFSPEFDEYNEKHVEIVSSIAKLWAIVLPVMWW